MRRVRQERTLAQTEAPSAPKSVAQPEKQPPFVQTPLRAEQQQILSLQQRSGNQIARHQVLQREEREKFDYTPTNERGAEGAPTEKASARFENDKTMDEINAGTKVLKWGDRGLAVTKMQQGLHDMGYILQQYGVDGIFKDETKKGLMQFQTDKGLAPASGVFDKATSDKFREIFGTRQPYIDNATFDPADPKKGLRDLSAADRKNVNDAMVPHGSSSGESAKFKEKVNDKHYAAEIQARMDKLVPLLHKELYADKAPLRATDKDKKENLHEWSTMEGAAGAAKDVTDALYGSYAKGPKLTHAAGNLMDQWEEEEKSVGKLTDPEKLGQATRGVIYLIENNCTEINEAHSAVPSRTEERALLAPVVASFVDSPEKIQRMLEIDIGWEGTQGGGTINLQLFKSKDQAENRKSMWTLFHTCIHEYIHLLKHADFEAYALSLYNKGETSRYNTLIEGMCDFFTENVRPTVKITPQLRQEVEGPYYDEKASVPDVDPATYPAKAQAEQMISITGVRNAQEAYFHGDVARIGGTPQGKKSGKKSPSPVDPQIEAV